MKKYPAIQGPNKAPQQACIAFDKLDGSNLRFEYSKKKGWHKFGTRACMFGIDNPIFGSAIEIFFEKYADQIEEIVLSARKYRATQSILVFCEFFGENSFAGWHDKNDKKDLVLFDVALNKQGIISPKQFIDMFSDLHIPKVIFEGNFSRQFISDVYDGNYPVTFEGVVAKGDEGHKLWMAKAKTKAISCEKKADKEINNEKHTEIKNQNFHNFSALNLTKAKANKVAINIDEKILKADDFASNFGFSKFKGKSLEE